MAKRKGNPQNLKPPFKSGEEAREAGRKGGIRSGEVRREQAERRKDARAAVRYMLELAAKGQIAKNLTELGVEKDEQTNMIALQARLFSMAMNGNLEAYMALMRMAGYDPEENRKERESIASDRRRDMETEAKMTALGSSPEGTSMALNMTGEDGGSDVTIFVPKMLTEEECQVPEEDEDAEAEEKTVDS